MGLSIVLSPKRLQLAIFIFTFSLKTALGRSVCPKLAAALFTLAAFSPAIAAPPITGAAKREAESFYQTAYAAYTGGDYARSLGLLDSAEAIKPDFADCLNLRGIILLRQNAFDKAEAAFAKAVALDAGLWAAQFNLGEIPFRKKDFPLAKTRFEKLLSHTNRFKERNQWELVAYKAFLACLLTNDEAGAQKKMEKLPATGGVTPAYQYAQAAQAFSKRDGAGAAKWLTIAQASYAPALNSLFSDSLVTAGWAPSLPASTALALARQTAPGIDSRRERPASAYLDTRLEASAAEPLPAPDGGILPMLPTLPRSGPRPEFSLLPERQRATAPPEVVAPPAPAPSPVVARDGLDRGGLLLLN